MSISLKKVAPLKSVEPITVTINDQKVTVKQYIPIIEKSKAIQTLLGRVFDEQLAYSPLRASIFFALTTISLYTNISLTETMIEEKADEVYDLLVLNNIYNTIVQNIPEKEFKEWHDLTFNCFESYQKHNYSILASFKTIVSDYDATKLDVEKLMSELQDEEKIGLVKDIVDKIG